MRGRDIAGERDREREPESPAAASVCGVCVCVCVVCVSSRLNRRGVTRRAHHIRAFAARLVTCEVTHHRCMCQVTLLVAGDALLHQGSRIKDAAQAG